jgi:anti-sigma B factor antagonist
MTEAQNGTGGLVHAELLQWSVARVDEEVRISLDGEVDLSTGQALSQVLAAALDANPTRVVVDLASLSFLDSTGIKCLVDAMHKASAVGCKLVVQHPSGLILRMLEICGVDRLLLDDSDEPAARAR